jgi:aryl-alcohol dehydrogenase-like predicted oxidoreductase
MAVVAIASRWAARKGVTPGQFSLAWLMAQKPWIIPIPGTTQRSHLLENVSAGRVRLSADELTEIRSELQEITPVGTRAAQSALTDL